MLGDPNILTINVYVRACDGEISKVHSKIWKEMNEWMNEGKNGINE